MSETTRDAFGPLLYQLQAEMRSMRLEQASLRALVNERAETTEAWLAELLARRFDLLDRRLDQTERSIEERLDRIEKLLAKDI
jgi:hypothetical protein